VFPANELSGGGRGIRTPGTLSGTTVFKTARFNRSRIPPGKLQHSLTGLNSFGQNELDAL
jgi:hypothetical protein